MNTLDQIISYIAPSTAAKRVQSRVMLKHLGDYEKKSRRFEGSSKGSRTSGWNTSSGSINNLVSLDLKTLVDRSRYLTINNSYAKRGVKAIASHTVGAGILPQVTKGSPRFESLLKDWAESLEIDAEGRHDLYGLQYLVMKTVVESGECLVRKRLRPTTYGLNIPLQIQIIEPDFLDTSKGVMGIEFDDKGRRTAYWLYEENPNETRHLRLLKSIRVPAGEILHIFETHRPGQVRGFPWLSPCILRVNDLDDYESAQLTRQKIAACLVGVITDKEGDSEEEVKSEDFGRMEPGSFEVLPPGRTMEFSKPPTVEGYGEYVSSQLHAIAAGLEVPYIVLANDYSRVNFSSSRMAFMEFYRSIDHWRWHMLVPQFLNPLFKWFLDASILSGKAKGKSPRATWVPPKREFIDPKKEIEANIMDVRAGFISQSEMIRSRGYDPKEVFEDIAKDYETFDALGISVSTDTRKDLKKV